jgi:hypothetical protein
MLSNLVIYGLIAFMLYQQYKSEQRQDESFRKGYERGLKDGRTGRPLVK